jgi:hypothetical protein
VSFAGEIRDRERLTEALPQLSGKTDPQKIPEKSIRTYLSPERRIRVTDE